MTVKQEIALVTQQLALRDEIERSMRAGVSERVADLINELAYVNKQLEKAGVIPAL